MGCAQCKKSEQLQVPETGAKGTSMSHGSKSVLKDILECHANQANKAPCQISSTLLNNDKEPEGNAEVEPEAIKAGNAQAAKCGAEGLEVAAPLLGERQEEEEQERGEERQAPGGDPGEAEGAQDGLPTAFLPGRRVGQGSCFRWCGAGGLLALGRRSRPGSRRAADDVGASLLAAEEPEEPEEDPLLSAARELQACLGDAGLCCLRGQAGLAPEGRRRALEVAELLKRHPQVGATIIGHTNPPSHDMTAEDLAELALARARHAKLVIQEAGCKNPLAAKGAGCKEGKGARCEVVACASREVGRAEAAAAKFTRQATLRRSVSALPVAFDCGGGRVRTVVFSRRPLGICFDSGTPVRITEVEPKGQAEELGVQEGWTFQAIAGEDVSQREPGAAAELLARRARALPRAASQLLGR